MSEFLISVDWASVLIGAGAVASALGFGLGGPLMVAGRTLREVRQTLERAPIKNEALQAVAENLHLKRASQELKKLPLDGSTGSPNGSGAGTNGG